MKAYKSLFENTSKFCEDCPPPSIPNRNKICSNPQSGKPVNDKGQEVDINAGRARVACDKGFIYDDSKHVCVPAAPAGKPVAKPAMKQSAGLNRYKPMFNENEDNDNDMMVDYPHDAEKIKDETELEVDCY